MLILKAVLKKIDKKQDIGCVLFQEKQAKLTKMKSGVDCIFIIRPFMHIKNTIVANCQSYNSNLQQFEILIQMIAKKVQKISSERNYVNVYTQNEFHAFSILQVLYELNQFDFEPNVRSLSNPEAISFSSYSPFSIKFLIYDLLNYRTTELHTIIKTGHTLRMFFRTIFKHTSKHDF